MNPRTSRLTALAAVALVALIVGAVLARAVQHRRAQAPSPVEPVAAPPASSDPPVDETKTAANDALTELLSEPAPADPIPAVTADEKPTAPSEEPAGPTREEPTPETSAGPAKEPTEESAGLDPEILRQVSDSVYRVDPVGETANIDVEHLNATMVVLLERTNEQRKARIADIEKRPEKYAPPVYYVLSHALFVDGRKDDAAFWFYAGQLRARYDANRCKDVSARSAVGVLNQRFGTPINRWTMRDRAAVDALEKLIERVLAFDAKTPHDYDHRWINLHGMNAVLGGLTGKKPDPASFSAPESEWPAIKKKTRANYREGLRIALKALREIRK